MFMIEAFVTILGIHSGLHGGSLRHPALVNQLAYAA